MSEETRVIRLVPLMTPTVTAIPVPARYQDVTQIADLFRDPSAVGVFAIFSSPFGDERSRQDAECVLLDGGECFSLEIMRRWVRIYVGRLQPRDDAVKAANDAECARVAGIIETILDTGETR